MVVKRKVENREFKHAMRGESAKKAIGKIEKGCEIFGLTKGQFSMIDILGHVLEEVGASTIDIGTWTAAHSDVKQATQFLRNNKIKSIRFLVDRSFPSRQPKYFDHLIDTFGLDSVRLAKFHAKFITIRNENFNICVRTSMNLNKNTRIENFEISDDAKMCDYMTTLVDEHYKRPLESSTDMFKSLQIDDKVSKTGNNLKQAVEEERLSGWD